MRLIFDIETDGFLEDLTKIHCIVIKHADGRDCFTAAPGGIQEAMSLLEQADELIGHNISRFDIPALQKVYPAFRPRGRVIDTQVLSRLLWPDVEPVGFENEDGKKDWEVHSLRAWGHRLGTAKGDFGKGTDWQEFSEEMLDYCRQDVEVTQALWRHIEEAQPAEAAVRLEHAFAQCIYDMIDHGVCFDEAKARDLEAVLNIERAKAFDRCKDLFPGTEVAMKRPRYFTDPETGTFYETKTKAPAKIRGRLVAGPPKVKRVPFNPSSRVEIIRNLERLGWKPAEFTPAGQPKLDEDTLRSLDLGVDLEPLADLFMLDKRLGYLSTGEGALTSFVQDGRIHGWVNHNGTPTARCRHSKPNLSQCPSLRKPWGREFRELFAVPQGYRLVGCDAGKLELVIMAHYMAFYDEGLYAQQVSSGDIHTLNQQAAGLDTRDQAKTFIYALNYGAGDHKLGTIKGFTGDPRPFVNANKVHARRLHDQYVRQNGTPPSWQWLAEAITGSLLRARFDVQVPAYARLKQDVQAKAKSGFLTGLDGRPIKVRSPHRAINALFQAGGAVVMKQATVNAVGALAVEEIDARMVLHVHDEFQFEVREDQAEDAAKLLEDAIEQAARDLNLRCPLGGEAKIGHNWAETH